ncbi:bestrophin family protein [Leeuwenhoekiella marinoflava]|uniref:bestrophin family protein n=1 Tax=Leeuwenhoekiella marinoflava TaxID=988 RepID=UPI003002A00F
MLIKNNIRLHKIVSGTWKYLVYSLLTCSVAYFINDLWLKDIFIYPSFIPTILGTALAFFIGFNNNQAYDRWWEARKIWGSLVNNSRTWTRQLLYFVHPAESIANSQFEEKRLRLIKRHIAFLYALKENLRTENKKEYESYLSQNEIEEINRHSNKHNAILSFQSKDLDELYQVNSIDGFKFMELNKMIVTFCDDMGKSERIKNTVFPTTYNYYSKAFIWIFIYSVTMTIGNAIGIWSIIFGTLVGYIFFTIQSIGQTLLNPFQDIRTGIPLSQITRTIEINLLEMLDEENIPEPIMSVDDEYIM